MRLPAHWQNVRLGDLLEKQPNGKVIQQGWSPQCLPVPAEPGDWGVLKTTAIQPGRFVPEENKALPSHLAARPSIEVESGDLLITCAGPRARCGVPALVRTARSRLMMSGKMYRLRPGPGVLESYLELWLLSPEAQSRIDAMKTGISDSGLNLTHSRFVQLPVPVTDLDEQRRIVEIIEDHFSRLDAADDSLARAERRATSLLDIALHEWRRDSHAPLRALGEVAETSLGKMLDAKKAVGKPTPYLANINVRWGRFDLSALKTTLLTDQERERLALRPGDILACEGGEPGRCAVWQTDRSDVVFQKALHRIRVRSQSHLVPEFLALMLRESVVSGRLDRLLTGTTIKHLPQEKLRSIRLPMPGLGEQQSCLRIWRELQADADRTQSSLSMAATRAVGLRRAILAAAFSGRLTGSASDADRIEELASALRGA